MIRHIVFFSARDPADTDRIVEGLSLLKGIPNAEKLEIQKNTGTDRLSDEVDVVVYGEFADQAALDAYRAHPLYQQSIAVVRPLRDLRIAAGIFAEDGA
jgi:quinol monooxygenase YgiN